MVDDNDGLPVTDYLTKPVPPLSLPPMPLVDFPPMSVEAMDRKLVASGGMCAPIAPIYDVIPPGARRPVELSLPDLSVERGRIVYARPLQPIMPEQTWWPRVAAFDRWLVRSRQSVMRRRRGIVSRITDTLAVARHGRDAVQDPDPDYDSWMCDEYDD